MKFDSESDEIDEAEGGASAIDLVRQKHYDLILMDIQMPGMDGIEATRQIITGLPKEKHPTIVALTAGVMKEEQEQCLAAGMTDVITKPFTIESLSDILMTIHPQ